MDPGTAWCPCPCLTGLEMGLEMTLRLRSCASATHVCQGHPRHLHATLPPPHSSSQPQQYAYCQPIRHPLSPVDTSQAKPCSNNHKNHTLFYTSHRSHIAPQSSVHSHVISHSSSQQNHHHHHHHHPHHHHPHQQSDQNSQHLVSLHNHSHPTKVPNSIQDYSQNHTVPNSHSFDILPHGSSSDSSTANHYQHPPHCTSHSSSDTTLHSTSACLSLSTFTTSVFPKAASIPVLAVSTSSTETSRTLVEIPQVCNENQGQAVSKLLLRRRSQKALGLASLSIPSSQMSEDINRSLSLSPRPLLLSSKSLIESGNSFDSHSPSKRILKTLDIPSKIKHKHQAFNSSSVWSLTRDLIPWNKSQHSEKSTDNLSDTAGANMETKSSESTFSTIFTNSIDTFTNVSESDCRFREFNF
ncbi:unnamed protein product [Meganyctiphanes norvegica]|uniref:Uncharacterized protein n=1 Tax=Meganyctiphanes norvegica TaxID=48144 RepID=A0AAV2RF55_MEGNR